MGNILLITTPRSDSTTYYISNWSKYIIDEAKKKQFDRIILNDEKANKKRFLGTLKKKIDVKMLVVINGHGNEYEIYGHDDKTIISYKDAALMKLNIIYARSCKTISQLGQSIIRSGALAYIGYDANFKFYCEDENLSRPLKDKTAALFLEPSNYVAIALLKGHSATEANIYSRRKILDNIKNIYLEGYKSPFYYILDALYSNMMHQVCIGNGGAKL